VDNPCVTARWNSPVGCLRVIGVWRRGHRAYVASCAVQTGGRSPLDAAVIKQSRTSSIVRPRAELNSTLESCCATSYWYVHDRKESRCGALALLSMAELPVGAASLLQ
jgi:hypothetical protein